MAPRLDDLPQEIIDAILTDLSVQDSCNLRLVSRPLQWQAIQRSFRDSFRQKRLEITQQNLENFVAVTRPGRLGCLIEDLTLYGLLISYEGLVKTVTKNCRTRKYLSGFIELSCEDLLTPAESFKAKSDLEHLTNLHRSNDEMVNSEKAVALLSHAFKNISTNASLKQLSRLSLEINCIIDDPSQRYTPRMYSKMIRHTPIWPTAAQTFRIAMSALTESELRVQDLAVFNSPDLDVCSLFRDQLGILDFPKLKNLTSHLKTLSLSILARDSSSVYDGYGLPDQFMTEDDFTGLGTLVAHCTTLKVLDVHYYSIGYDRGLQTDHNPISTTTPSSSELVKRTANQLELLVLAGLVIRENDLLEFLKRNRSTRLELDHIKLTEGSFRSILDFCSNPDSGLTSLRLTSLFEKTIVWFSESNVGEFDLDTGAISSSFSRDGDDIWLPIFYHVHATPIAFSQLPYSPKIHSYMKHKIRRFGPLSEEDVERLRDHILDFRNSARGF